MKQVKIIDCGVPPLGWQREFGVETPEGIIFKSQGSVTSNTRDSAKREAILNNLDCYFDENNVKVLI